MTASAPSGMTPPVEIAIASPAARGRPAGRPAATCPTTGSRPGRSPARTAYPSIAELANGGRSTTAEAARAVVDLPPFASSAMDGYAVRAGDLPGRLPVVGHVAAGRPAGRPLAAGEAMAISTGGVIPDGADAVIPVEYVVHY